MRRFTNPHRLRELMLDRVNRVNKENERRAEAVSDFEMVNAMILFGGSFVMALGRTWYLADEHNRAKLLSPFPELVEQYRELARLKRG